MLKLNNKKYSKVSYQVSFGEYKVKQNGKERTGKSPRITFMLEDFHLMLEFIYDKEWIKKLKINDKDYFIYFYCNAIEDEEEFNILLNEIIDFTKET